MPTIRMIVLFETDDESTIHIIPEIVMIRAREWCDEYIKNPPNIALDEYVLLNSLMSFYRDSKHIRYIFMIYMLLQEIEEIETKSSDELSSDGNDNSKREDWDSSQPRHGS